MELPYFLMPIWASWLLAIGRSAVMRVVPLGIIVAGFVQILVSPAAGAPVFPTLWPRCSRRHRSWCSTPFHEGAMPWSPRRPHRRTWMVPRGPSCPSSLLGVTCALIVVASLVVYVIHAQWTGLQDQGPASPARPDLHGLRHARGGGSCCASWWTGSRPEASRTSVSCSCSRLPFAGLYLSHAIDGVALVVSVIPLNVVYADAAVLRLVRSRHL